MRPWTAAAALLAGSLVLAAPASRGPQATASITIRGKAQTLHLNGPRTGEPVVVTSGDGGWIHLAPHIADVLSARGYFVTGFDARAYLSGFTTRNSTLKETDVPGDYLPVIEYAAQGGKARPILVGVSEGGGLSVLAATRPDVKARVRGVIGVGLPDATELAWRWRDMLIYLTHGVPDEPTFSTAAVIDRVAPLPVAVIQSTHDEYVPLTVVEAVMARARDPKRLWTIDASDHAFNNKLPEFDARLLDAIAWIISQSPPDR